MASFRKAVSALVVYALLTAHSSHEELLVLPEGEIHNILCTAPAEDHYAINWGTSRDGEVEDAGIFTVGEEETVGEGMKGRQVIFNATSLMNSTILRCVVINFDQPSSSPEPLEFIIITQGTLPAPDVEYSRGDGSILFSWSPPFSHNITDVEPDISHYLVNIINMEDHSVLTVNTTETEYLLQSQDCQLTHYQVEIAAVNVVGVGDKYPSPSLPLDDLTVSDSATVILGGDTPVITFQVDTSCRGEIHFDIQLIPTFSQQQLSIPITTKEQSSLTLSDSHIQLNELYDVTLTVDGTTSTYLSRLSTFDVQNVEIRQTDSDEYEMTCYFAAGSKARGCRIVLIHEDNGECELNVTRPEGSGEAVMKVTLPAGECSIMVYDDDDDDMSQQNSAFTTTFKSSSTTNSHNIDLGCFLKASSTTTATREEGQDGTKVLKVTLVVVLITIFIVVLLAILGVFAVLFTRKSRAQVSTKPGHHESAGNEYVERKSFLCPLQLPTTEPNSLSGGYDSPQQAMEQSSPSENRESSPSQHSLGSNSTTDTQISSDSATTLTEINHPPAPTSATDTHNPPYLPNTTTEGHNTTVTTIETQNSPPLPETTTEGHNAPDATNLGHKQNRQNREESCSSQDSSSNSPTSTTPLVPPRERKNYVEVEHNIGQNVQSPPQTNDSVLYSTIVPHSHQLTQT